MCESKKNARNNKILAINMRTEEYEDKEKPLISGAREWEETN